MKKVFGIFVIISGLMFIAPGLCADMIATVTGHVVSDGNESPVVGTSVIVKGTGKGGAVDIDGKYTLTNVPSDATLVFSNIAFEEVELPAKANMGTITLKENTNNIDDVLVTSCNKEQLKAVNATGGTWFPSEKICEPTTCIEPRYELADDLSNPERKYCRDRVDDECTPDDKNAVGGFYAMDDNKFICKIVGCNAGWTHNEEKNRCEEIKECPARQVPPHAKESKMENGKCIAESCECGYQVKDNKCVEITNKTCTNDTKPKLPKNAQSATMECDASGKTYCKIDKCNDNFTLENNKCEKQDGTECTHTDPNATKAKNDVIDGKLTCVIKKCKDGYLPNDDGTKCEVSEGECSPEQLAKIENATKGELKKGKCKATECKDGFEPSKGECKAKKEKKDKDKKDDDDGLSDEEKKKRQAELDANAKAMKEKEQSTANKMLGAVGMGATGIGAMQMMSGAAEQKADEDAEADMKAYLETFTCKFGDTRVKGGEKNIELPGANALMAQRTEYIALANDLKTRKESLGMKPGIESELILDQASTGLYDDVHTGKTGGKFTSVSRALLDKNSDDAKAWAEQKADAADKKKTGTTTAIGGAGLSAVGNVAANGLK